MLVVWTVVICGWLCRVCVCVYVWMSEGERDGVCACMCGWAVSVNLCVSVCGAACRRVRAALCMWHILDWLESVDSIDWRWSSCKLPQCFSFFLQCSRISSTKSNAKWCLLACLRAQQSDRGNCPIFWNRFISIVKWILVDTCLEKLRLWNTKSIFIGWLIIGRGSATLVISNFQIEVVCDCVCVCLWCVCLKCE